MNASHDTEIRAMPWWAAVLLTVVAAVATRLAIVLAAGARAAGQGLSLEEALRRVALDPLNLGVAQVIGVGLAIFVGLRAWHGRESVREVLRVRPVPLPVIGLALIAGLALQFPLAEIGNLMEEIRPTPIDVQLARQRLITPSGAWSALAIVLAVVVVAPATEELLFRGMILRGLRERHGAAFAVGLSALLFGLMHVDPNAVVYATIAGLVLGAVALRTGSTMTAIAMHAGVNAVPVLVPERLVRIPGFNTVSEDVYHLPLPLVLGTAVVAALALAGVLRLSEVEDE